MIKGKYELRVFYDVENGRTKKEIMVTDAFENSREFVAKLMTDLGAVAPVLDKFIPVGEEEKEETDADIQDEMP